MVLHALPGVISEYRASNNLLGMTSFTKKEDSPQSGQLCKLISEHVNYPTCEFWSRIIIDAGTGKGVCQPSSD